jgi:DNA-directed RNA polymerase subunit M/transcription elongation factor TFIIS
MLNTTEVKSVTDRVRKVWPGRFNNEQIAIIIDGLSAFSFDDSMSAIKDCAIDVGFVGAGEIVTRARVISAERARVTKTKKEVSAGCGECIHGHIFAMKDGYEYAFQCRCAYDAAKPIPMWDSEYIKKGFRKKPTTAVSGPREWERKSQAVSCGKCGNHIGETQNVKINYKQDGVMK